MGTRNDEFDLETTVDLDNIDENAAKELLARGKKAEEELEVVQEGLPTEPAVQKPRPVEADPTDEELESYSESVKKRISKLTFDREEEKRRAAEAARERDEAIQFAQQAMLRAKQLEEQSRVLGESSATALLEKLEGDIAAARREYVEAANSYDTDAMAAAQEKMADLVYQRQQAKAQKAARPVAQVEKPVVQPQASTRPAPDERAQGWVARNSAWFQKDKAMTAFAFGVHEDLVEKGVDPRTEPDIYYRKLDEALQARFPEKFEQEQPTRTPRTSPVAPASRAVNGRKRVTLTQNEMSLARKFGLTPEQFAAEKMKLENRNG